MNATPVSGPMSAASSHHDGEWASSRASLRSSHANADLGERKEHLFEVARAGGAARRRQRRELVDRAFAADASGAQEHEAIADAGGVGDLMDRQEQRASAADVLGEHRRDFARLSEIEPVERLV